MDPPLQLLQGCLFALAISLFSYRTRLLTGSGSIAQFFLGWILLGLGGWQWTFPILVFFFGSTAISRLGREKRKSAERLFAKSGSRDGWQVLANGAVPALLCLLWAVDVRETFYVASIGALGAAAADTWGTELGTLSRRRPRLITTLRPVEAGTSGGVTLPGTSAGILGALVVVIAGLFWTPGESRGALLIAGVAAGFGGSLVDSILGATLQRGFLCPECGRKGETKHLCSHTPRLRTGLRWMTNDVVNLLAAGTGALIAWKLFLSLA